VAAGGDPTGLEVGLGVSSCGERSAGAHDASTTAEMAAAIHNLMRAIVMPPTAAPLRRPDWSSFGAYASVKFDPRPLRA
jgi:hypothetical protein